MPVLKEFAVLLEREGAQLATVRWPGASETSVRERLAGVGKVLQVDAVRPIVDWSKPYFSREEAAEFLGCSVRRLTEYMGQGKLPKSRNGEDTRFKRADLERLLAERMTEQG